MSTLNTHNYDDTNMAASFAARGNYMDPSGSGSLGVDDPSRFRSTSVVPPKQVELMQGSLTLQGANSMPSLMVRTPAGFYTSS